MSKKSKWYGFVKTNVLAVVVVLFFIVSSLPLPDAVGQDIGMVGTTELAIGTAELHVENPIRDLLRPSEITKLDVQGAAAAYANVRTSELANAIDVRENELIVASEGRQKVKLNSNEVYFAVEAEDGTEHYIRTQLVGAREVEGDTVRHTIKWTDVLPHVDIEYRLLNGKLKEYLYLKAPAAEKSIVYKYEIDADSRLELCADGKIKVSSRTGDTELYELEAPVAADANGVQIHYRYELDEDVGILKLIPVDVREFEGARHPIIVDPTYLVAVDCYYYSTAYNNQRKLARKLDGTLCTVYYRYPGTGTYSHIFYAYSTDEGKTWTEEQLTSGSYNQLYPSIAIDSGDNVHVVWHGQGWGTNTGYNNIMYLKRNATTWQTEESVTDKNAEQIDPSIAIDSSDQVRVVWAGKGWGANMNHWNIQFRGRSNTSWLTQESVTDVSYNQTSPSIAIDSGDDVHVVWCGSGWGANQYDENIQYRVYYTSTSTWSAQEGVTDINADQNAPSIALDSNDNVHVVWYGKGWGTSTGYYNIQYRKRTSTWQVQERITNKGEDQNAPSIAIDPKGNVHVVWYGVGWGTHYTSSNIQYRKRVNGWHNPVSITDQIGDQYYPNLIWAKHPMQGTPNIPKSGYAFVWVDTTNVLTFELNYTSSDLSWNTDIVRPTAPRDGAELTTNGPIFRWQLATGFTQTAYRWQASYNSSFDPVIYDSGYMTTSEEQHQEPSMLIGTWYWRVKVNLSTGASAWSVPQSVTILYTTPTVTLTSPNGGENLIKGEYHAITWRATGLLEPMPIALYYSTDNGDSWTEIVFETENTGYYNWTIPSVETSNALVRVTCRDSYGATVTDVSDRTFTIDPPLVFGDESYAGAGTSEQSSQARTPARAPYVFSQLLIVFLAMLGILAVCAVVTVMFRRRKRGS